MGLSERRACTLLDVSRSGFRYERVKATADAPVLQRMKELALQYDERCQGMATVA